MNGSVFYCFTIFKSPSETWFLLGNHISLDKNLIINPKIFITEHKKKKCIGIYINVT